MDVQASEAVSVGDRVRSSLLHARTGEVTRIDPADGPGLVYVRWDDQAQDKGKLTHAYYLIVDEPTEVAA